MAEPNEKKTCLYCDGNFSIFNPDYRNAGIHEDCFFYVLDRVVIESARTIKAEKEFGSAAAEAVDQELAHPSGHAPVEVDPLDGLGIPGELGAPDQKPAA